MSIFILVKESLNRDYRILYCWPNYFDYNYRQKICDTGPQYLGEFGVYDFDIDGDKCIFSTALEPVNAYLAILYCFLILLGFALLYILICIGVKKGFLSFIVNPINKVRESLNPELVRSSAPKRLNFYNFY